MSVSSYLLRNLLLKQDALDREYELERRRSEREGKNTEALLSIIPQLTQAGLSASEMAIRGEEQRAARAEQLARETFPDPSEGLDEFHREIPAGELAAGPDYLNWRKAQRHSGLIPVPIVEPDVFLEEPLQPNVRQAPVDDAVERLKTADPLEAMAEEIARKKVKPTEPAASQAYADPSSMGGGPDFKDESLGGLVGKKQDAVPSAINIRELLKGSPGPSTPGAGIEPYEGEPVDAWRARLKKMGKSQKEIIDLEEQYFTKPGETLQLEGGEVVPGPQSGAAAIPGAPGLMSMLTSLMRAGTGEAPEVPVDQREAVERAATSANDDEPSSTEPSENVSESVKARVAAAIGDGKTKRLHWKQTASEEARALADEIMGATHAGDPLSKTIRNIMSFGQAQGREKETRLLVEKILKNNIVKARKQLQSDYDTKAVSERDFALKRVLGEAGAEAQLSKGGSKRPVTGMHLERINDRISNVREHQMMNQFYNQHREVIGKDLAGPNGQVLSKIQNSLANLGSRSEALGKAKGVNLPGFLSLSLGGLSDAENVALSQDLGKIADSVGGMVAMDFAPETKQHLQNVQVKIWNIANRVNEGRMTDADARFLTRLQMVNIGDPSAMAVMMNDLGEKEYLRVQSLIKGLDDLYEIPDEWRAFIAHAPRDAQPYEDVRMSEEPIAKAGKPETGVAQAAYLDRMGNEIKSLMNAGDKQAAARALEIAIDSARESGDDEKATALEKMAEELGLMKLFRAGQRALTPVPSGQKPKSPKRPPPPKGSMAEGF